MIFSRKRRMAKRYEQCEELVDLPGFLFDVDIKMFMAQYEEILSLEAAMKDLDPEIQKLKSSNI